MAGDAWSDDDLRAHAAACIRATGEPMDQDVFDRLAARMTYVAGDFGDDATYQRVGRAVAGARTPVFYLEIPPSLFATVVKGLTAAGLAATARLVIEKPFGHDLDSARALAAELHEYVDESQLFRIDHFLGEIGVPGAAHLRFATRCSNRCGTGTTCESVQITMAERFGVDDRGHFYDPVGALRDVVVNHLLQVLAAVAMEPPAGGDPAVLKDGVVGLFRAVSDADPGHYVRGQYEGYLDTPGSSRARPPRPSPP